MLINDVMKITRAGQVTIPKIIRDKLQTDTIMFEIVDEEIHVIPVTNVAGALSEFSKQEDKDFSQVRDSSWQAQTKGYKKDE
ncbi:hypothetical protein NF27_DB00020 [Candidatus Jidaibacter acanthamoeba]|uniref:SpoVT-AbrB domain-containing protein n=1 Tax=Candidatus Jidaibacter acanthamoebae TaxID=86105 RepID=A0A0C1QNU7_9RICK|nr:AbrB/MazE/SpoVT family DNA-binding domain-containing protein [Candidatus Jidaibacter acanthamoeba]KIE05723.1 hypothetical protein NF27_DC00020 [Candidatus Jidaibacter acanthamoeba]KIE05735.1 hypothetical protein NF27_DB00020 [Candidatus Jidaibacter acanthamoeba]